MSDKTTGSTGPLSGKIVCHAMWAHDGRQLADFYATALGPTVTETYPAENGEGAASAFHVNGVMYLFYNSASYQAPNWPEEDLPFHMDLTFPDAAAAEKQLLELGATKPAHQPGGKHWTVLLDPAGRPFCIHDAR
ncbi:hypothetical protein DF17_05235 [Streptomyces rimosus]|uniref:VOC family protein n=1 Tax=Streptomyces rimosus TaxID=1927 RepID=UPI0004D4922A|nr:VOC family protein [Streptomyces rimosus]KEF08503.1 hypothetical protein DF17_05235 [Streptomyces rimosus]